MCLWEGLQREQGGKRETLFVELKGGVGEATKEPNGQRRTLIGGGQKKKLVLPNTRRPNNHKKKPALEQEEDPLY